MTYIAKPRLHHPQLPKNDLGLIQREKRLKRWHRAWKVELIEKGNPDWRDLASEFVP